MSEKKPEVHLEVCSGFFRIPTETVNYNITVLESQETSATKVVEKIVEVEKAAAPAPPQAEAPPPETVVVEESFYREAAGYFSGAINDLAAEEAAEVGAGGSGVDPEALGRLSEVGEMAGELKQTIVSLKNQTDQSEAGSSGGSGEAASGLASGLENLGDKLASVKELLDTILEESAAEPPPPPEPEKVVEKKTRYMFGMDAVFQTIYELCTNETVKEHVQAARAKAGEIFALNDFLDLLSQKASSYSEDDGFYSVPLSDVLSSLRASCNDAKIQNLLKNMDKNQADIFLDQFLPLEVPPTEEIEVEVEAGPEAAPEPVAAAEPDPRLAELHALLEDGQSVVDTLAYQAAELASAASDQAEGGDLGAGLDDALNIAASIDFDLQEIGVSLQGAGQTAGGPGDDWRLRVKGAALALASCLNQKEADADLDFEAANAKALQEAEEFLVTARKELAEVREAAQPPPAPEPAAAPPPPEPEPEAEEDFAAELDADFDGDFDSEPDLEPDLEPEPEPEPEPEVAAAPPPPPAPPADDGDSDEVSQDDIDRLLEQMG